LARTDNVVEIALVPPRATRHLRQRLLAFGRQRKAVGAPVAVHALALHQPAPDQILDYRSQARFVAPLRQAQRPLADARIARDQRQRGEAPRAFPDLLRMTRERLERSLLRHTQIKSDPVIERT